MHHLLMLWIGRATALDQLKLYSRDPRNAEPLYSEAVSAPPVLV